MSVTRSEIMAQLQRDILPLQGFKSIRCSTVDVGLGPIRAAFPNAAFPTGAVHEFLSDTAEQAAATAGFISGILGSLLQRGGVCLWVGAARTIFPSALKTFGIAPDRIIFIDGNRINDTLWVMEEALKCAGLTAVVGEIRDLDFKSSRRLQLAVEQSRVTGFLLRHQPRTVTTIASVARWRITPLASATEEGLPGVGYPRWQVELLKIRNGKPGVWPIEWAAGRFQLVQGPVEVVSKQPLRKIG